MTKPHQVARNSSNVSPTVVPSGITKGIGELRAFPDGSKGIVFFMTNDGHGLAVSLDEMELKWENVSHSLKCRDIASLPNEESEPRYLTFQGGLQNTIAIIQEIGEQQASAAAWCAQHGDGWYLPSAGELWYLFSEANEAGLPAKNGLKGKALSGAREEKIYNGPISAALRAMGGRSFIDGEYWSSTECDKDDVMVVRATGNISQSEKPKMKLVRAVRAF